MFGLGIWELLVILLIVLVLFGARRLPELGEGLGRFVRSLRSGLQEEDSHKESSNENP
ncbi:MAG TPA: twin-arginine translocase TatA/TatE family subunit [Mariprofundaceae bacterium]|nr:twin-arginine translocase TatA/TatE family subunit [Mariprofundaceae bacterium]